MEDNKNKPTQEKEDTSKKEESKPQEAEKETKKEDNLSQQLSFLKAESEKSKAEAEQWKNKYYEAFADLANTRKSLDKDHQTLVKYRAQGFIERLLPALDSFQMAFSVEPNDDKVKNYCAGFKMILGQLEQALKDEGASVVLPKVGDKFDPADMHAIQTVDGEEEGLVASVYVKGYRLYDRLIRPAMVVVTKKKAEPEKKEETKDPQKAEEVKK